MDRPLSIVIFSKDRAAQLDLCLSSIYKNLAALEDTWKIHVIYTSSSTEFEMGYDSLKYDWDYSWLYFHQESVYGGFKQSLENAMEEWGPYVLFFTDDDIIYKKFEHDWNFLIEHVNETLFCLSFRLGSNTFIQDQYRNTNCIIPDEVILGEETIKTWNWKTQEKDTNFAYPFAVDGHMFESQTAKRIIKNTVGYDNPNSLEGKAQHSVKDIIDVLPDMMGCFNTSIVINTPINRVQETCTNTAGVFFGDSAERLNEEFLSGKKLSLTQMDFSTVIGVHQEIKLKWET